MVCSVPQFGISCLIREICDLFLAVEPIRFHFPSFLLFTLHCHSIVPFSFWRGTGQRGHRRCRRLEAVILQKAEQGWVLRRWDSAEALALPLVKAPSVCCITFTSLRHLSQPAHCSILETASHLPCQCLVSRYVHLLLFIVNIAGITKCYKCTQYTVKIHKQLTGLAYKKYYSSFVFHMLWARSRGCSRNLS